MVQVGYNHDLHPIRLSPLEKRGPHGLSRCLLAEAHFPTRRAAEAWPLKLYPYSHNKILCQKTKDKKLLIQMVDLKNGGGRCFQFMIYLRNL